MFLGMFLFQILIAQTSSPLINHQGIHFIENAGSWKEIIEKSEAEGKPILSMYISNGADLVIGWIKTFSTNSK